MGSRILNAAARDHFPRTIAGRIVDFRKDRPFSFVMLATSKREKDRYACEVRTTAAKDPGQSPDIFLTIRGQNRIH
ncbi:hypothetical protein [Sinomicrobium sp. M5D2P17]